nr:uncharacterized protein LOC109397698 [Aedes albopictus]
MVKFISPLTCSKFEYIRTKATKCQNDPNLSLLQSRRCNEKTSNMDGLPLVPDEGFPPNTRRAGIPPTVSLLYAADVSLPDNFLKVHFPYYELYLTETAHILRSLLLLLLFFRCVRYPERFFQQICDGF